ncbi:hypothetical protein PVAP13_5KG412107 [Panicum virgatum]|uniref:Uncharacterized protein n=1 Tax=Panicum virgatum TaxID=38727 RepID=A0A8T0SI10_PANVG|nr:hypothetical protein PVAP13_5KG412107 [Panicum virgatum]
MASPSAHPSNRKGGRSRALGPPLPAPKVCVSRPERRSFALPLVQYPKCVTCLAEANRILPPPTTEGRRRSSSSALRPRRLPPLQLPTSREEGAPWTPRLAVLHRRGLQRDDGGQAPSQEEGREARRAHPQHLERGATVRARDGGDEGPRDEVEHAAHGVDRRSEARLVCARGAARPAPTACSCRAADQVRDTLHKRERKWEEEAEAVAVALATAERDGEACRARGAEGAVAVGGPEGRDAAAAGRCGVVEEEPGEVGERLARAAELTLVDLRGPRSTEAAMSARRSQRRTALQTSSALTARGCPDRRAAAAASSAPPAPAARWRPGTPRRSGRSPPGVRPPAASYALEERGDAILRRLSPLTQTASCDASRCWMRSLM